MRTRITRRDFLKVASASVLLPMVRQMSLRQPQESFQGFPRLNLIIILFDALSATNLSIYGYQRKTSPNLERFASRATVFHNHHSAGNFTTPSTASLFTGVYPWTHRAFTLCSQVNREIEDHNLFRLFDDIYHQLVFSQNISADVLLNQFSEYMDRHVSPDSFSLVGHTFYNHLFSRDANFGMRSYDDFLFLTEEKPGSLFASILNDLIYQVNNRQRLEKVADKFPVGFPLTINARVNFRVDQVIDGIIGLLDDTPAPCFVYLHLLPPHGPYKPSRPYLDMFDDGWSPPAKKRHHLGPGLSEETLYQMRHEYDEFIANMDAEFGRLLDYLEKTGWMENSYVIVTSDHGELFERGTNGHSTPLVFEPVVHIPLMISSPEQRERKDVHALTSNVDLFPTLSKLAGLPTPDGCEGLDLLGLSEEDAEERTIYVVEAKNNPVYKPMKKATLSLIKGQYKLIQYLGYPNFDGKMEFYDLKNDPDELQNLYKTSPVAKELRNELNQTLEEVDQRFN